MKLTDFNYELPTELIAQRPLSERVKSRLLVLNRCTGAVAHHSFSQLLQFINSADLLVFNETKVRPVRLIGQKEGTGAVIELLLLRPVGAPYQSLSHNGKIISQQVWESLVRPGKRVTKGTRVQCSGLITVDIGESTNFGGRQVGVCWEGSFDAVLHKAGQMPLPPYIKKPLDKHEEQNYQTVFARKPGSAAAPTAGLHFDQQLLAEIAAAGIGMAWITLHIGLDTFRPVSEEHIINHQMHKEYYEIDTETIAKIIKTKEKGGRIIAVGTTVMRCLETAARVNHSPANSHKGYTDLFIYPGFDFKMVDGMITNFHLPRSTLLMLVAAFAGRKNVLAAYEEAVVHKYRFYSFGDAMLII